MPTEEKQPQTASAYEQLTAKQRAFVDALCADPNISGTQAAITAGYSDGPGASVEATRQLRNAKVRQALGERLKDTAPTSEEIAARWDRVSRATLDDFYTSKLVEYTPRIRQPLTEAIAELEGKIAFDREYAERSAQLLGLADQALSDYMENETRSAQQRRLTILRYQMLLEADPGAFRVVDGPAEQHEELVLDLVKAQRAGVLDMAKSIKPTQHGLGVELRDPDAALDKLARMAGAYEKDNEQSKAVMVLNAKVEIIPTGKAIARNESDVDV